MSKLSKSIKSAVAGLGLLALTAGAGAQIKTAPIDDTETFVSRKERLESMGELKNNLAIGLSSKITPYPYEEMEIEDEYYNHEINLTLNLQRNSIKIGLPLNYLITKDLKVGKFPQGRIEDDDQLNAAFNEIEANRLEIKIQKYPSVTYSRNFIIRPKEYFQFGIGGSYTKLQVNRAAIGQLEWVYAYWKEQDYLSYVNLKDFVSNHERDKKSFFELYATIGYSINRIQANFLVGLNALHKEDLSKLILGKTESDYEKIQGKPIVGLAISYKFPFGKEGETNE